MRSLRQAQWVCALLWAGWPVHALPTTLSTLTVFDLSLPSFSLLAVLANLFVHFWWSKCSFVKKERHVFEKMRERAQQLVSGHASAWASKVELCLPRSLPLSLSSQSVLSCVSHFLVCLPFTSFPATIRSSVSSLSPQCLMWPFVLSRHASSLFRCVPWCCELSHCNARRDCRDPRD